MNTDNNNSESESLTNGNGVNKNLGRKTGSRNKLSKEAKQILFDALKNDLYKIDKLLNGLPNDERITHLKYFSKYLATGNDEIANEVRNIIYKQLQPHFRRMGTYVSHIDQNKKVTELRSFLKLLGTDKIEEIITDMHQRQKVSFTNK
jgi:hypothetical protein